jgi:hypothetical protein
MRNTLNDLNNHLFAQLERLGDEDIKGEQLQEEITRAKAISDIATQIISNGTLVLKAETFRQEYFLANNSKETKKFPPMLSARFLQE